VAKFGKCPNLSKFFDRVRNAVSHKHLNFGPDPDSRIHVLSGEAVRYPFEDILLDDISYSLQ
jgi:hypothetical protein